MSNSLYPRVKIIYIIKKIFLIIYRDTQLENTIHWIDIIEIFSEISFKKFLQ